MQQRQLRLGDILDDYCPRERRITNHAVVAMVGAEVKQTRCTTCDAEHEYKHARVPRQRRKSDTPAALYAQVGADAPKRVTREQVSDESGAGDAVLSDSAEPAEPVEPIPAHVTTDAGSADSRAAAPPDEPPDEPSDIGDRAPDPEEGPVHRPLIRATLPRPEGQPPPARPVPEFTIRQPGGRPNRFRHRHQRGVQQFHGNRSNGNMAGNPPRGNTQRPGGGRPPIASRLSRFQGPGRKRSK
jgi:hypothetical protein